MVKSVKVVGLNTDTDTALALVSSTSSLHLYLIISGTLEDAFSKVRQTLVEAENFFDSSAQAVSQRIEETLQFIEQSLSGSEKLQVLVAASSDDEPGTVFYLLCQGDLLVADLWREGKCSSLNEMGKGELASGVLKPGDRIVLATQSLKSLLGEDLKSLSTLPLENFQDEVEARLPQAEACPIAVIIVEAEKISLDIPELEPSIPPLPSKKVLAILSLVLLVVIALGVVFVYKKQKPTMPPVPPPASQETVSSSIFPVSEMPLWLDLNLVKAAFNTSNLSLSHGSLLLLDSQKNILVEVGLENKAQQILAGEEKLGKTTKASLNGDFAFVYSDKGLVRVDTKGGQITLVTKPDPEWGKISDLFGFAGNVYLLDEGKQQVWKYIATDLGYSEKRPYLREDTKADFSGVKKMQIDSSIWVLKNSGEILKYTQGAVDFFSFSGLDKPIKNPQSFYVSDETDNLYLLDSENKRLLVMDKKGTYLSQYQSDQFSNFTDLVVDEKGKKVYLLGGSKIFQMDLK